MSFIASKYVSDVVNGPYTSQHFRFEIFIFIFCSFLMDYRNQRFSLHNFIAVGISYIKIAAVSISISTLIIFFIFTLPTVSDDERYANYH